MEEERPKVNQVATIVNNLFLDSEYLGKDWEKVRIQLIQELTELFTNFTL